MPPLPENVVEPIAAAIYAAYERRTDKPRRYLGASIIGKPCDRALWYEFRWCGREEFSGRMLRLFESGHLEEIRLVQNLRDIGVEVHDVDGNGQQFAIVALGGHFRGHMDGAAVNVPGGGEAWHVCEFKTHNAKSFAALRSKGVRAHKPEHFAQMQVYMHLAGMDRALYVAVNKDTDEIHIERVRLEPVEAMRLVSRARSIITATTPPAGVSTDRDSFACKWCNHKSRCHGPLEGEPAVPCRVTCRSCCHATPIVDESEAGAWRCERHKRLISETEQERACDDHLFIPELVTFAEPVDAGDDSLGSYVEYATRDGRGFYNGTRKGRGDLSSRELASMPASSISLPIIDAAKAKLGATVVAEPIPANLFPPAGAIVSTEGGAS